MASVTDLNAARQDKQEKGQGFDLDSVLGGAAKAPTTKSKSKTPIIEVPPEIQEKAARLRQIVEQMDSLESEQGKLEAEVIPVVDAARLELCRKGYVGSVKFAGSDGLYVGFSWKDQYSKIDPAHEGELRQATGDGYDRYFEKGVKITTKQNTPEKLRELIQLVGPDRFAEFFSVEQWLMPTKAYTEESYRLSDEAQAALALFVRQYKPTLRTK